MEEGGGIRARSSMILDTSSASSLIRFIIGAVSLVTPDSRRFFIASLSIASR